MSDSPPEEHEQAAELRTIQAAGADAKSSPVVLLLRAVRFARPCPAAGGAENAWGEARRDAKGAETGASTAVWLCCGVSLSFGREDG